MIWIYDQPGSMYHKLTYSSLLDLIPIFSKKYGNASDVLQYAGPNTMRDERHEALSRQESIIDILIRYRAKICMDPRDRIYAILGLVETCERAHFSVDYSISVRRLFIDVIKCDLEENKSLDSICVSTPGQSNQYALPSWVSSILISFASLQHASNTKTLYFLGYRSNHLLLHPQVPDWTAGKKCMPLNYLDKGFAACGWAKTDAVFLDRRSKLQVSGIWIDKIRENFVWMPEASNRAHIFMILHAWRADICRSLGYDVLIHDSFSRVISLGQKFSAWNTRQWTLVFNSILDNALRRLRPEITPDYILLDTLDHYVNLPLSEEMDAFLSYDRYIGDTLSGRQLSMTKTGLLCLSNGVTIPGDSVFVLAGCSVPVVLRRLSGNEYKFIGEIYVDGYMFGGAMEDYANRIKNMETVVLV